MAGAQMFRFTKGSDVVVAEIMNKPVPTLVPNPPSPTVTPVPNCHAAAGNGGGALLACAAAGASSSARARMFGPVLITNLDR